MEIKFLPVLRGKLLTAYDRLLIRFLFMLNAVWAVPAVILIRIVRPIAHLRIGTFLETRIGHFVADASILFAIHHIQTAKERTIDLIWLPKRTCNEQWSRMVRRQLFVRWWVKYLDGFNRRIPGGASHRLPWPSFEGVSNYNVLSRTEARLKFTLEEEKTAKAWLRRRGWRDSEPFVCLLVRDSAYLSFQPYTRDAGFKSWNYHDYRDSNIDDYVEAIQELLSMGYWVIRMGKIMHKRLCLSHQRVIDYPFVDDQQDLMDIWLSANCRFFISSASGLDTVAAIYGRPIVFVNALPLLIGVFFLNRLWVPKHLRWHDSGKFLTLKEHSQYAYTRTEDYEKAGIDIINLTPSEITAAVLECEQRTAGTRVDSADDRDRQRRYWDTLRESPNFRLLNKDVNIHPNARAGSSWLASAGDAFFD